MEKPGEDENSVNGSEITFVDVEKKEYREFESIPYTTVEVDDPDIYEGESKITTAGKDGQRATIYEDTYEDGIFVSRVYVGTEIVEDPVQEVIANGTKKKPVIAPVSRYANSTVVNNFNSIKSKLIDNGQQTYANYSDNGDGTITIDGQTYSYEDKQTRTVTMYDGLEVCMQQGCHTPAINHNTFSGVPAQRGIVATYGYKSNGRYTGSNLPLGTVLFIQGYGLAVVGDIHGVHSNPNLLDLSYDPGEIRAGTARVGKESRAVYILSTP
jgi:3D (Asp-Asp-Asp) domain-containing protein